jgi:hypothetical protein
MTQNSDVQTIDGKAIKARMARARLASHLLEEHDELPTGSKAKIRSDNFDLPNLRALHLFAMDLTAFYGRNVHPYCSIIDADLAAAGVPNIRK